MRLNFNALWIDDQPAVIQSSQNSIKRKIAKEGFNFSPTTEKTIDEAIAHLRDTIFLDEVDLILVDYDLGKGPHGDTALKQIRQKLPYKDIIFYSANAPADLKKLAFDQDVQGIYCTSREDLVDTTVGVFETLVKKVLDIDHVRGIVMGATSDIDAIVHDCLTTMYDSSGGKEKNDMHTLAIKQVTQSAIHSKKQHDKSLKSSDFLELLGGRALTAFSKIVLLNKLLKDVRYQNCNENRTSIANYLKDTLPLRNKLGHVQLIAENGTRIFAGRNGEKITEEEMRELRCALIDHRDMLLNLVDKLSTAAE